MSTTTLYQLAFNKTCLHLWDVSPLASLNAEFAHRYKKKYADQESKDVKEYQKECSVALKNIEEMLEQTLKVPLCLRRVIMNAVDSVDSSICSFMSAMGRGLIRKTLSNIKYCARHIVFTDKLRIDMTETLYNIMLKSKFDVMFSKKFLGAYCLKKGRMRKVYVQVCEELDNNGNPNVLGKRKSKRCCRKISDSKMEDAYEFIEHMMTGKMFWEKQRHQDGMEDANNNMMYATDMQYVAVIGPFDALKYYYERTCREPFTDLDDETLDCAKYLFLADGLTPEKLAFFQEKLGPQKWKNLLEEELVGIFLTYLSSWCYRDRCMPLFVELEDVVDKEIIQGLLRGILYQMADNEYDYYGIMNVAKELWDEIPNDLRSDRAIIETVSNLVPNLTKITMKFEVLTHFLKDYSVELQEDIIAQIIFQLVAASEEDHIEALVHTAQAVGLKHTEGKEFFTHERLKTFLINDAGSYTTVDYEKVAKFLCKNEGEVDGLKDKLLRDKPFITEFLVKIRASLIPFFKWALKDDAKINAFKAKLSEDGLIDCIYERRLLESDLYYGNKIFAKEMLELNDQQITDIRKTMKDNTALVRLILLNSMATRWSSLHGLFENFFFYKDEKHELMQEFLYLPETIQEVYDMVLDLSNFEMSMKYSRQGSELMLQWLRFITDFVKPFTDADHYFDMLLADIDSVVEECYKKVKLHPKFGRMEENKVRFNIELRFSCFSQCRHLRNLDIALQNNLLFVKLDPIPFMLKFTGL